VPAIKLRPPVLPDPRHRWTVCTGHMGNTFPVLAGGVDAVERVFGDG